MENKNTGRGAKALASITFTLTLVSLFWALWFANNQEIYYKAAASFFVVFILTSLLAAKRKKQ